MKKLTKFYILSILLSAFAISSCTKDEITGEGDGNVIESEGYLEMSELADNPVSLTAEQGTYILKVISDKEWTASVSYTSEEYTGEKADEWCILSSKTGVDASEIYIGFTKNKWNIQRSASVNFSFEDSDETYSLALNQEAAETVYEFVSDDIKENGLTFKKSGDTYKVNLVTNAYQWTVSLVGEDEQPVTWCSINQSEDGIFSGKGDTELTITAGVNESGIDNKAFLKFTSLETTFENKLSLKQNAELMPFEGLETEIIDNGTEFKFNWRDETPSATFKLILAKDQGYTEIIDEISDASSSGNEYSVDLLDKFENYVGIVYAKLECNDPINNEQAIVEKIFNSHFGIDSGDGSEGAPYIISNVRHLKNISAVTEEGKFFKQNVNIELPVNTVFTPLCPNGFNGIFDGGNHTISNLYNDGSKSDFALFGKIAKPGIVRNVQLDNVKITCNTSNSNSGSIAAKSQGSIYNCIVTGSITCTGGTDKPIGGLVGEVLSEGSIQLCVNRVIVDADQQQYVGGICGKLAGNCVIKKCGNEASISSSKANVGGIIGGLSGDNSTVEECYNKGDIVGPQSVAGIVGGGNKKLSILNCYNEADIQSLNKGNETNIASGILSFTNNTNIIIKYCYNRGNIVLHVDSPNSSAITNAKDLINKLEECFYLKGTATQAAPQSSISGNESKDENQMKQQTTFQNWDFGSVWTISDGDYPRLQWEQN